MEPFFCGSKELQILWPQLPVKIRLGLVVVVATWSYYALDLEFFLQELLSFLLLDLSVCLDLLLHKLIVVELALIICTRRVRLFTELGIFWLACCKEWLSLLHDGVTHIKTLWVICTWPWVRILSSCTLARQISVCFSPFCLWRKPVVRWRSLLDEFILWIILPWSHLHSLLLNSFLLNLLKSLLSRILSSPVLSFP